MGGTLPGPLLNFPGLLRFRGRPFSTSSPEPTTMTDGRPAPRRRRVGGSASWGHWYRKGTVGPTLASHRHLLGQARFPYAIVPRRVPLPRSSRTIATRAT
jgi:hypothetical protein